MNSMVVDIAPQQQPTEVFTTNRSYHRSSSSSSTHRRSSTTTNHTSSLALNNKNKTTMTNGHEMMSHELSRKAEQILGIPTALLVCGRQTSIDFHAPRLTIAATNSNAPSRHNQARTASSTTVHNLPTATIPSQSATTVTSDAKNKRSITVERLVPLIFQLVAAPTFPKLPEMISRRRSNPKVIDNIIESREMTLALHRESVVKLSDDENEDDDGDDAHDSSSSKNTNSVLTEITDNRITNNGTQNQNNSNDNHPAHSYENLIEPQHSGISSGSRCPEDNDSEEDDSDNQEAVHSDAENDDETNETNPNTLSLMDFVRGKEIYSESVDSSFKHSSESFSQTRKRSISPGIERDNDNHVHNSEDHQNKRKKLLIKRALLKSFISSVNTKISFKRPALSITIPTHLFFDQSISDSNKHEDDQSVERSQRTSKRYSNGSIKQHITTDVIDGFSQHPSSLNNQKKNKTSHSQEKSVCKPESSTMLKNEQTTISNVTSSSNDTDTKIRPALLSTNNTATVTPMITSQPKKEKPTANVKPLQQSATMDGLSSSNVINNGINISDSLTTSNTRSMLPSTKSNYMILKNMSKTDLTSLARKKKKQADIGKRGTFEEVRQAMGLYLESVCYFIKCAHEETKQDQRTSLLSTTLTMLQQLADNHKRMFYLSNSSQSNDLYTLQQKFLLINYWLQSYIYHLQLNTNMPTIERCASQVANYFNQQKNPNPQQQSTPINDNNPISPLSTASQTSSSDLSSTSANNQIEQHRYINDFAKIMLYSYHSTSFWNKAGDLMREKPLKKFIEQLLKQNQNRHLSRDDTTLEFILYIFDAIELLRLSVA